MRPISVLLVGGNPAFQRILTRFLEQSSDVVVTGVANGEEKALVVAETMRPRVILLDLAPNGTEMLETISRLRQALPGVSIIATIFQDVDDRRQATLAAGADDFIAKTELDTDLLPAIRKAAQFATI